MTCSLDRAVADGDRGEPARLLASCDTPAASADWTIERVLSARAVRTLFQPIVHLASGTIAGFEALSRGPAGSALESPLALLDAARAAGRLGELDWLCRHQAMNAASQAGLPSGLSWLINVEPAGSATAAASELGARTVDAARSLRVILEVVEREVEDHVSDLLHAADRARLDSWGVALDDVGAEEGSLALLPFLRPDVVKLDMSLLREVPGPAAASITAAVRAHAERTGAVVLAEGIETEEQERLALIFGATYGQGYRYGRPGALPDSVPAPLHPIPLQQQLPPLAGSTPFDVLSAMVGIHRAAKSELLHISHHLEQRAARGDEASVLLACFQDRKYFTPAKRARYAELAASNTLTVVLAEGLDFSPAPRYQIAPLADGSRLAQEWVVIVINPHYAAAFVARDCGDTGAEGQRHFDYVYTHDRDAVVCAARTLLTELRQGPAGRSVPGGVRTPADDAAWLAG